jgi:hypothetical protein
MREITLSTSALFRLLGDMPAPDDPDPVGPWGPVIRNLDAVALNPQPLPPGDPFARIASLTRPGWSARPAPQLWTALARSAISTHLDRLAMAGIIIVGGDVESAGRATAEALISFADDLCPTPPHPFPWPSPWGPRIDAAIHPINLLAVAAQLQQAAESMAGQAIGEALEAAADRLLDAALGRLEQTGGSILDLVNDSQVPTSV